MEGEDTEGKGGCGSNKRMRKEGEDREVLVFLVLNIFQNHRQTSHNYN
jgi:hypothetical protein